MSKIKLFSVFFFVLFTSIVSSQITSSTLSGKITDGDTPIANAKITIIHLPTNASFDTTTDKKGRFSLDNLDVGGPYRIMVKSDEIEEYKRNGIQLVLGDNEMTRAIVVNRKEVINQKETSKAETVTNM